MFVGERTRDIIRKGPRGFRAVGIFLFFGAIMASFAGTTLIWQGTILDRLWELNPVAHRQLAPFGQIVGALFLLLGACLGAAGIGWLRHYLWGWRLAVGIIAAQAIGDVINSLRGDFARGGIGFAIAGALLVYLFRPRIRGIFAQRNLMRH